MEKEGFIITCSKQGEHQGSFLKQCLLNSFLIMCEAVTLYFSSVNYILQYLRSFIIYSGIEKFIRSSQITRFKIIRQYSFTEKLVCRKHQNFSGWSKNLVGHKSGPVRLESVGE